MPLEILNRSLEEPPEKFDPFGQRVITETVLLVVIALISISANLIVSLSLVKRQRLATPSNRLVFSLTFSNLLLSIIVLPFIITSRITYDWPFGAIWCQINGFVTTIISLSSTATLAMIAIDRYLAIVKPMLYALKMTNSRVWFILLGIYILAIAFSIPPFFIRSSYKYNQQKFSCVVQWRENHYFSISYIVACFLFPFLIMLVCYYLIFQVARTKCRRISFGVLGQTFQEITPHLISATISHHHSTPTLALRSPRKPSWSFQTDSLPVKSIWTICIIIGSFVISYLPLIAELFYDVFAPNFSTPRWLAFSSLFLLFASPASYAFIYGLYNRSIRKEIKVFLFPKSSDVFQGLPSKQKARKISRNCSLMDFSSINLKAHRSAPVLSQLSTCSSSRTDLPSLWNKDESPRKHSQDSGAVMTLGGASDMDINSSLPSSLNNFVGCQCSAPPQLSYNDIRISCKSLYVRPQVSDIVEVHSTSSLVEDVLPRTNLQQKSLSSDGIVGNSSIVVYKPNCKTKSQTLTIDSRCLGNHSMVTDEGIDI